MGTHAIPFPMDRPCVSQFVSVVRRRVPVESECVRDSSTGSGSVLACCGASESSLLVPICTELPIVIINAAPQLRYGQAGCAFKVPCAAGCGGARGPFREPKMATARADEQLESQD